MISNSKSTTLYSNNGYAYTLNASFTENSTSTENNTSNITCTATFTPISAYWSTSYPSTLAIYWHDNKENYDRQVASITFNGLTSASNEKYATGVINATHKDDGTLSGYAKAVFTKGSTTSVWACNSGDVSSDLTALTTIARGSQPTISPSSTFNIGDTITIETNRKSTSFNHTISLSFGTYTYQIGTGVTDSITLNTSTIASNLYQQTPNDNQKNGTITCVTYNGATEIGTTTTTFTAVVTNSNPTFTPQYEDTNPTTLAITSNDQYIIRNNSYLELSITNASGNNYATLTRLYANINGTYYEGVLSGTTGTINVGILDVASDINALVGVEDSRYNVTETTLPITILDWVQPSAIINIQRENNYYTPTNINVDASYSSLNGLNTISIKARYKKKTDGSYGAYVTLTDGVTSQLTLDNLYAWNVQVLLEDAIGSTTYNLFVDRGLPIIFFDRLKQSVGVECFPLQNNSLEVNGADVGNKYTTTEMVIGSWLGKPLYRKVLQLTELPGYPTTSVSLAHGISNFEMAVTLRGFYLNGTTTLLLPFMSDYDVTSQITISADDTNINLLGGQNYQSSVDGYIIIEYTKTTD